MTRHIKGKDKGKTLNISEMASLGDSVNAVALYNVKKPRGLKW